MTNPTSPILSIQNLEVIYNHVMPVLKGVSLEVGEGQIIALLGNKGSGKSTTMKTISRTLNSDRGEFQRGVIEFEGESIIPWLAHELEKWGLVYVEDRHNYFEHLTVEENLITAAYTLKGGPRAIHRALDRIYEFFPRLRHQRNTLTGFTLAGEKEMVAIGCALISRPQMLLLDEPSRDLSPIVVEEIYESLKRLNQMEGLSILVSEQDPTMALQYSDYAYVLENGTITAQGTPDVLERIPHIQMLKSGFGRNNRHSMRDCRQVRRRKRWLA